jgi:hypothetical protein
MSNPRRSSLLILLRSNLILSQLCKLGDAALTLAAAAAEWRLDVGGLEEELRGQPVGLEARDIAGRQADIPAINVQRLKRWRDV